MREGATNYTMTFLQLFVPFLLLNGGLICLTGLLGHATVNPKRMIKQAQVGNAALLKFYINSTNARFS